MIETHFRKHMQPFFNTVGALALPLHITPNMITMLAFFAGISAGILIAFNYLIAALILLICSGLLDILDGTVARLTGTSHKIGAYIDLISDRMVEASIILGLTIAYPEHYLAYVIFLSAVLLHFSTFVVAGTLFPNMGKKSMHYDQSLVERAEAFVVFFALLTFPAYIFELLMLLNGAIIFTALTRFIRVWNYAYQQQVRLD